MLKFENMELSYDPYPIGLIKPVLDDSMYQEMLELWPDIGLCRHLGRKGQNKYYLNESKSKIQYNEFIRKHSVWREFHSYIKSESFIAATMQSLMDLNIDLGYFHKTPSVYRRLRTGLGDILKRRRLPEFPTGLYARFEFSMLPANGGAILPHTDDPKKLVTIVCYIQKDGEWNSAWGGGLEICWPKDPTRVYNFMNQKAPFEDVNVVRTYDYLPNSATLFVTVPNSWHSVHPMVGENTETLRRTLTIVIERN
jgi:hypothetical protein